MGYWNTMYKKLILVIIVSFVAQSGFAQLTTSPFTQIGIGDKIAPMSPIQLGMGGVGISNGDVRYINVLNPALLVYNTVYNFSAGLTGSSVVLSDDFNTGRSSSATFSYLAMSFPMKSGKWTTSIALRPYSTVAYKYKNETEIIGTSGVTYTKEVEGNGGINQFTLSNGVRLLPNLSLGVNASFLFGSIFHQQSTNQVSDTTVASFYGSGSTVKETMSDFAFGTGIAYNYKLKEKLRLNVGLTYDLQTDLKTKRIDNWETQFNGTAISTDSLSNGVENGITKLPSSLGFGISLVNSLKWSAGADIKVEDWSQFQSFNTNNSRLNKSLFVALGGEITPDAGDINSYLSRVTYRLGVSYEKTPYVVNDNSVNDFGINFGFSLPVNSISSLDMGFKYGNRGNISKVGHKEEYFKFQLGFTFNDRLWFIKRKFD